MTNSRYMIRPMEASEAEAVAMLIGRVIAGLDFYNDQARQTEQGIYTASYLAEAVAADRDAVLVACDANRIAGFCVSRYDDDLIWLSWFGVAPGYEQRGIGMALLSELAERRRAVGVHKIWCDSRTENHASRAALAKAGYHEICQINDHWYRQDYVLLECYL